MITLDPIPVEPGQKIYFASDFHLGTPNHASSLVREKKVVAWLDQCKIDAAAVFLMGDVFDFWFEYAKAVPRGFVRLLGKIAELADAGIPIHWFTGNHDMWIFNYLPMELGVKLHHGPVKVQLGNKKFYLAHGDGLGPGDHGYKFIKKVFRSRLCQWLFARLHPNFGIGLADFWSGRSRNANAESDKKYLGASREWLSIYSSEILTREHFDYFIYGHRHLPMIINVGENSTYFNIGDWITNFTFGEFDGSQMELKVFGSHNPVIYRDSV